MLSIRENENEHIFTLEDCYFTVSHKERWFFCSEIVGSNRLELNYVLY